MPSRDRVFSKTQRMERSSSTIQTGFIFGWLILLSEWPYRKQDSGLFYGQTQGENRVAGPAGALDTAMMVLDEVLGDGQPQAATTFAAGNQRVEHALADFVRNTRAVVDHLDFNGQPVAFLGQGHLAQGTRPENDLAIAIHRLCRVTGNVEYRLNELLTIANQLRQARILIAMHRQRARKLGTQQAAHALQDFMDIHRRRQHRPMRRQQALHQRSEERRVGKE